MTEGRYVYALMRGIRVPLSTSACTSTASPCPTSIRLTWSRTASYLGERVTRSGPAPKGLYARVTGADEDRTVATVAYAGGWCCSTWSRRRKCSTARPRVHTNRA
jgi:hypothetical protein